MPNDLEPIRFRLTEMDELPRHQTGTTFDVVANESPHWSDGYYFTLGDHDGRLMMIMGFRLYTNNDVLDAFVLISHQGRQHNMRWSRRLRPAIDDLSVGPLSVEIVEGLRTIRIAAAPNEYGITFDLLWEGFTPPYNEDYLLNYRGGRLISERSNYDQCSLVSGVLEFAGARYEVDHQRWVGVRDHSWGVGSTGGRKHPDAAPLLERDAPPGLRNWCVWKLDDRVVFFQFHHDGAQFTKWESQVLFPYGDQRQPYHLSPGAIDYEFITDADGTLLRRLHRATIELVDDGGRVQRWQLEPVSPPCYCLGGGYWNGYHDQRGRGAYRGDLHHEGEVWDISHPTRIVDPLGLVRPRNEWAESWGRFTNLDDPSQVGYGHLECAVLGPYPPQFA